MKIEIKKVVEKEIGKKCNTKYVCVIDEVEYVNYHIFRKLLGITDEEGLGILNDVGEFGIKICSDSKTFKFDDLSESTLQSQLQKRVNAVKEWISTLSHKTETTFILEV